MKLLLSLALLAASLPAFAAGPLATDHPAAGRGTLVSRTGEVEVIDPAQLTCDAVITFDDVAGGPAPGVSYDAIFESDGADFAERFAGQTLTHAGNFDVLGTTASSPLRLAAGDAGQNLCVFDFDSNAMCGLGPVGFPDWNAIGEGSFAVLFDYDQSEFGFDLVGGGGGSASVSFFRRDGSLIDVVTIDGLGEASYGLRRAGGVHDIAGISIHNNDPEGMGFDNLCHDVGGVAGNPPVCDAGGPYDAYVGTEVLLDASGSFDPDGGIVEYYWEFGDDTHDTGQVVTHVWTVEGTYTVTLTVTDADGLTSWCEAQVFVQPSVPTQRQSFGGVKALYH